MQKLSFDKRRIKFLFLEGIHANATDALTRDGYASVRSLPKSLAGDALKSVETATSVRVRGGKTETMDGPFAETKEQLGGFYLFDCANLDEAIKYAAMIPSARIGSVEVRPVLDLSAQAQ